VPITVNRVALLQALVLLFSIAGFLLFAAGLHVDSLRLRVGYFPAAVAVVGAYVFFPTFLMGMATPPMLRLLSTARSHLGRDTGRAHLVNYLGSVVAIILVGFILVPHVSLRYVILCCLAMVSMSATLLFQPGGRGNGTRVALRGLVGVGLLLPLLLVPNDVFSGHVARSYKNAISLDEDEYGLWGLDLREVDEHQEGLWPSGERIVLQRDGYVERSVPRRGQAEWWFSTLAAFLHPRLETVFMGGLGLGSDANILLRFQDVQLFEAAELSRSCVTLAQEVWDGREGNYFEDERFKLVLTDARAYLTHTSEQYHVIVASTVRSFSAGSTHLYSVEYWEIVRDRLAEDGLLIQWLSTHSRFSAETLLRTFVEVFPDPLLVNWGGFIVMIGFKNGPPTLNKDYLAEVIGRRPLLRGTRFPDPESFLGASRHVLNNLREADIPINRDDFPACEYSFRGFQAEGSTRENVKYIIDTYTKPGPPVVSRHDM
jgi:hypothetical protein